jgi:hypothetical protein
MIVVDENHDGCTIRIWWGVKFLRSVWMVKGLIESTALRDNKEFYDAWASEAEREVRRPRPTLSQTNDAQHEQKRAALIDAGDESGVADASLAAGLNELSLFRNSDAGDVRPAPSSLHDTSPRGWSSVGARSRDALTRHSLLQLCAIVALVWMLLQTRATASQALLVARAASTSAAVSQARLADVRGALHSFLQLTHAVVDTSNDTTIVEFRNLNISELQTLFDKLQVSF